MLYSKIYYTTFGILCLSLLVTLGGRGGGVFGGNGGDITGFFLAGWADLNRHSSLLRLNPAMSPLPKLLRLFVEESSAFARCPRPNDDPRPTVLSLLGMLFALDSLRPKFPNIASNMMSFLSFRTQGQFNTICRLFFFLWVSLLGHFAGYKGPWPPFSRVTFHSKANFPCHY